MKATKIIGAVLGVLLVAALFTGAAAAATAFAPGDTVFVYQEISTGIIAGDTFNLLNDQGNATATTITAVAVGPNVAFIGKNLTEGHYRKGVGAGAVDLFLKYPTVELNGVVTITDTPTIGAPIVTEYDLVDSSVVKDWANADITITPTIVATGLTGLQLNYVLTDPNMTKTVIVPGDGGNIACSSVDGTVTIKVTAAGLKKGPWSIQPYFVKTGNFAASTPSDMLNGDIVSFNVIESDDEALTVSADNLVVGDTFQITVQGIPGATYFFARNAPNDFFIIPLKQKDVTYFPAGVTNPVNVTRAEFKMPASGVFEISFEAVRDTDDLTISLGNKKASGDVDVTISIEEGSITASAENDSYIIGQDIKFEGTSTINDNLYLYVEGTNIPFTPIQDATPLTIPPTYVTVNGGSEWDYKLAWADLSGSVGNIDAGTYTFYVSDYDPTIPALSLKDAVKNSTYATAPVALKQSFIRFTKVPEVVAQNEKFTAEGIADASDSVLWYLFGTNYFQAGVANVKDDDSFKIIIDAGFTDLMDAGQYFLVVQHPMYDGVYAIAPAGMNGWRLGDSTLSLATPLNRILELSQGGIYNVVNNALANTGVAGASDLFRTDVRQTANAAQALCDALDSQNFDDRYVKASFIVAAPTSRVDTIPSQITKGQVLTISGTTTGYVGELVTVELSSTAFAALPKETVGTAAFTSLTTKIGDDGVWSITFDTSGLEADDYTCSVAVADLGATIAQIKVVEGTNPQPTQTTPVTPTGVPTAQPTATPATPGFGALAALAGLGAVAVLLLRRQ